MELYWHVPKRTRSWLHFWLQWPAMQAISVMDSRVTMATKRDYIHVQPRGRTYAKWVQFSMWHDILIALALMLVIEGFLPFLNPRLMRQALLAMAQMNDQQLRVAGLTSMLMGIVLLYLVNWHFTTWQLIFGLHRIGSKNLTAKDCVVKWCAAKSCVSKVVTQVKIY